MTTRLSRLQSIAWLFLILFFGFILRIWGLGFGLPETYHADEPIIVNHALAYGTGDLNPHFFNIPPLTSYLLFAAYGIYFLAGFLNGHFPNTDAFLNLFIQDPTSFYLIGRFFIGVFFGLLSIGAVYRISRLFWSRGISLIGAFFMASLYLPVQVSHFIYPDSPLLFCLFLSLYFCFKIQKKGRLKDHAASSLLIGLAVSFKYNAAILIAPFLVSHCLAAFHFHFSFRKNLFYLLLFAGVFLGTVFLLNPFFFLDHSYVLRELREQARATGFIGWGHHVFYSLKAALGIPLLFFVILSFISSFFSIRRFPWLLTLYAYLLAAYCHLVFLAQPYGRYGIFLIPPALIFSVFLLSQIIEKTQNRIIVIPLVITLLLIPIGQSVLLGQVLTAPDTRKLAKKWILENIPSGSKIFFDVDRFQARLPYCREYLDAALGAAIPDSPQAKRIRSLIALQGGGVCFEVASAGEPGDFTLSGKRFPFDWERLQKEGIQYLGITRLRADHPDRDVLEGIRKYGTLQARFTPYRDPRQNYSYDPIDLTGAPTTLRDLLSRRRNGHLIEIYRLDFSRS